VREDAIRLFGFRSDAERDWFRLLQSVQGVGAKVALAILSVMEPGALATAIATNDRAMIGRAPGVGPKLAQRLCAELKDKAPAFGSIDPGLAALSGALEERKLPAPVADAVSALVNLGYGQAQAAAAIAAALKAAPEGAATSALIRLGLKEMAK
jgi:Holliday junction DNA helicase RuvA